MRRMPLVRLAVFAASLVGLLLILQSCLQALSHAVPGNLRLPMLAGGDLVVCIIVVLAYRVVVNWLEARDPAELTLDGRIAQLVPGTLLGAGLFCVVCAALWLIGVAGSASWEGAAGLPLAAAGSLAAAVGEELIFRGVVFRIIEGRWGTLAALVFSAALFGFLHGANPGATVASGAAIALEAGVLLGLAYCTTRSLWLPIGVHFGWNFTEGGIFGAAVSGGQSHGLLSLPLSGPAALTGGAFGPEASVIAVLVSLCASAALTYLTVRRGHWVPLRAAAGSERQQRA
ncbi:MAG TPA: CPBP family intramembrane glutamic endopeptidase [Steroidobacteraceae bacterium]|nr:CPBP family intramembrane glutamic endopeptidase [Steroidobacteraceae bacterium]